MAQKLRKIVKGQTWKLLVQMRDAGGVPTPLEDYTARVVIGRPGTKGTEATITSTTYQFPGQASPTPCYLASMTSAMTKRLPEGSNDCSIWRTLGTEIRPTDPDNKLIVTVVSAAGAP